VQTTTTCPKITVTADGAGLVSHAGTRLLADLADATTLTAELSEALVGVRGPRARHDPGRVLVDLAVAIADGAEAISDIAVLGDQAALFGPVASDSTCWRLLDVLDPLPEADVIVMGMILHDWNLDRKLHLIRAAYRAAG
jgi:hypothetical protein